MSAINIIATTQKQWDKTGPADEYHFYGRLRAHTALESAIHYLARYDSWAAARVQGVEYGTDESAYDATHGLITQLASLDGASIRSACDRFVRLKSRNQPSAGNGFAEYILEQISPAAQRLLGDSREKFPACLNEFLSAPYLVISGESAAVLKAKATKSPQSNRRWLITLLRYAKYNQANSGLGLVTATPTAIYTCPIDYVLDELLALEAAQLREIFSQWGESEVAHNLDVVGALQNSIRHARRWAAPIDDKHVNGLESALLNTFLHHLAGESTDPTSLDLESLRETLGVAVGTLQQSSTSGRPAAITISHLEALPNQAGKRQAAAMEFL